MPLFSNLEAAVHDGIQRNLHTCVQVYVSVNGKQMLNTGFGDAAPDRLCTAETLMLWRSAGKPLTAALIARYWQNGELHPDDSINKYLPEASGPIGHVTLRELLTHQTTIPVIETGWPNKSWSEILRTILATPVTNLEAAYQPQSTWFLLGEILRRMSQEQLSFSEVIQSQLLKPLGMSRSFCGLETSEAHPPKEGAHYYVREQGRLRETSFGTGLWMTEASPGGNVRGPISDLGRFYEMMLRDGKDEQGQPFLWSQTVAAMTAAHRRTLFDQTLQHSIDMGLGFIIDSNCYGADTVPYGYSPHCSTRTFGHGGSQCSIGFCDPVNGLVVAWAANGFCGEGWHQRRNRAINTAIYQDLGLTDMSSDSQ